MLDGSSQAYSLRTLVPISEQELAEVKPKVNVCFVAFCNKTNPNKQPKSINQSKDPLVYIIIGEPRG